MTRTTHTIIMGLSRPNIENRLRLLLSKFTGQHYLDGNVRDFRRRADGQFACELELPSTLSDVKTHITRYFASAGIRDISICVGYSSPRRTHPILPQPYKETEGEQYAKTAQGPVRPTQECAIEHALAELQRDAAGQELRLNDVIQSRDEGISALGKTLAAPEKDEAELQDNLASLLRSHIGSAMDTQGDMLEEIFFAYVLFKELNPLPIANQISRLGSLAQYLNRHLETQFRSDVDVELWLRKRGMEDYPDGDIINLQHKLSRCRRDKAAYENAVISGASEEMLAAMRPFIANEEKIKDLEHAVNSYHYVNARRSLYADVLEVMEEYDTQAQLCHDARTRRELGCTFPIVIECVKGKSPGLSIYMPNVTGNVEALHKSIVEAFESMVAHIVRHDGAAMVTPFDDVALQVTFASVDAATQEKVAGALRHAQIEDLAALGAKIDVAYLERSQ